MLECGYGTQYFTTDLNMGNSTTVQLIGNDQRWDLDTIHVKIEEIDPAGKLVIGYGTSANSPEIASFQSICDTDIRIRNAGVDNKSQNALNAVYTGAAKNCFGSVIVGAHIVKQDNPKWIQTTAAAAFPVRAQFATGVLNVAGVSTLFVFGGKTTAGVALQDVWSSTDGINFSPVGGVPPWNARYGHRTVVLNGKIYLIGGYDGTTYYNDVYSYDGTTWATVSAEGVAPFSGRLDFGLELLNGLLYLAAGNVGGTSGKDVWSSPDGITWTQVTSNAAFGVRQAFAFHWQEGRLVLIGGYDGTHYKNDVWFSADGNTWIQSQAVTTFTGREYFTSHKFQMNRMRFILVVGGFDGTNYLNDAYISEDGQMWPSQTSADFTGRQAMEARVFNGSVYYLGGYDGTNYHNDVWRLAIPIV